MGTISTQNIKKFETVIEGLKRECQELNRDLVGAKEREKQYKIIAEKAKEDKEEIDKEYNETIVEYSGLEAKFIELTHNYKQKVKYIKDREKAFQKIEKERSEMRETNEKLRSKMTFTDKELDEKYKLVIMQRESMRKLKDRLIQVENEFDSLNSKHNSAREVLQTENYQLTHEISVLREKVTILKNSRHHWLKNIDNEVQENDHLRIEITEQKMKLTDAITDRQNMASDKGNIELENKKLTKLLKKKEIEFSDCFNEKEKLKLNLQVKNEMYDHLELKTGQYIQRIRGEHKKLKIEMEHEKDRSLMIYEDLRTKCSDICQRYQELLLEKIETEKGKSGVNKRIHSLE